jgi:hypothetical protein
MQKQSEPQEDLAPETRILEGGVQCADAQRLVEWRRLTTSGTCHSSGLNTNSDPCRKRHEQPACELPGGSALRHAVQIQ